MENLNGMVIGVEEPDSYMVSRAFQKFGYLVNTFKRIKDK
jgi:hypothetical protein